MQFALIFSASCPDDKVFTLKKIVANDTIFVIIIIKQ